MSFCFLYNVVSENYNVQNSPWGGGGSIASSRSNDAQWSDDTRKARESYWIRRLNTVQPHGINMGD